MQSKPVFSIIMPVYNVEQYISEAIESVLNQSFKDFELLIINDGSTDNSPKIAEDFKEKDSRILIFHQKNQGLSAARNLGIKNAKGTYIYFMDSDDLIKKETLSSCLGIFEKEYPLAVFFNTTPFADLKDNGIKKNEIDQKARYYERPYLKEGYYSGREYYNLQTDNNNFVASACLYVSRLDFIRKNKLFFEKGIIHEDELFTRQFLQKSTGIFYINEKLYQRRIRPNSITTTINWALTAKSLLVIAEKLFILYKEKNDERVKTDAISYFKRSMRVLENLTQNKKFIVRFLRSRLTFLVPGSLKHILALGFPKVFKVYTKVKKVWVLKFL